MTVALCIHSLLNDYLWPDNHYFDARTEPVHIAVVHKWHKNVLNSRVQGNIAFQCYRIRNYDKYRI